MLLPHGILLITEHYVGVIFISTRELNSYVIEFITVFTYLLAWWFDYFLSSFQDCKFCGKGDLICSLLYAQDLAQW